MHIFPILIFLASSLGIFAGPSFGDELIPPTRALGESEKHWGKVIVFSEPPGVDVYLDQEKVGSTPLWLVKVEKGIHTLRVADKEAQIYVEQGKKIKAGLFKGSFIAREEEDVEVAPQPRREERPEPSGPAGGEPAEEERKRDLTRWDRFINGSLPFF